MMDRLNMKLWKEEDMWCVSFKDGEVTKSDSKAKIRMTIESCVIFFMATEEDSK